jgi:hypothetical protein
MKGKKNHQKNNKSPSKKKSGGVIYGVTRQFDFQLNIYEWPTYIYFLIRHTHTTNHLLA